MGFLRIMPLAATFWLYSAAVLSASVETFNTTSSACDDSDNGLPFNSTGTVSFTPSEAGFGDTDPWYITAGLKDSRPANYSDYKGTQSVYFFLSVPQEFVNSQDANRTSYCVYQFDPKDTTTSKDDGSCDGLFSNACTKAIEKFQKTVSPANGECPQFPIIDYKECKGPGVIIHSDYIAGDSCLPNPLPGVTEVPENYATRGSFGLGLITGDTEIDSFDAYDRHVRQTYAMIVVVGYELDRSNDDIKYFGSDSKLRCLRPKHIVEGSRDPDSSAELLRWLKDNYGGEFDFLMSYCLSICKDEDREEGRGIFRAVMNQDDVHEGDSSNYEDDDADSAWSMDAPLEQAPADSYFGEEELKFVKNCYGGSINFMFSFRLKFYKLEDGEEAQAIARHS